MKNLTRYISLCFVLISFGFQNPETVKSFSQDHYNTPLRLRNGFYWIANGSGKSETLKMDITKLNKTYIVENNTLVKQNQIKSLEVSTENRRGKAIDVLTFLLDSQAKAILEAVKPNFAVKQEIGFVLNDKLVFVALFFAPFKGDRLAFSSKDYSNADLMEIKKAFDSSKNTN